MKRYCYRCNRVTRHEWYTNRRGDRVHECQECHKANAIETRAHRQGGATLRQAVVS